jgi:hypothetical protein
VVLVLFGFVAPSALEIVYIAWMSLAFTMGLLRNHTFTGKGSPFFGDVTIGTFGIFCQ